jgi:NADH-quinone oxidoreductase subunit E
VALSEQTRAAITEVVDRYPERRTALLPALKLAQRDAGWLPPDTIAEAADLVGVPHAAALELAAFYTMLHTEPVAPTLVVVCAQLPCALRGAEGLIRDLEAGLADQIADGKVGVERTSECFGACHRAPMARINEDYRENLDPSRRADLIAELSAR